ncbi:MAG: hypothetical protein ACRD6W_19155, partial [Nitrososphaerales archaeon]
WAANVPYGASNAPSGITVTVSSCTAGSGVTATSGPSGGAGFQIAGTNAAGLEVLSYGSNTASSSTIVLGANPSDFLPTGTSTFSFSAYSGGTSCVSGTYSIDVTTSVASLSNSVGSEGYVFDSSYFSAQSETFDIVDADTVDPGTFNISSSSPGTGFSCTSTGEGTYPVPVSPPTAYDHECSLQAAPGDGDDDGDAGSSPGTTNTVTIKETDSANPSGASTTYMIDVLNPPICVSAPDGTGQSTTTGVTGTPDTKYTISGETSSAVEDYNGSNGPDGALITGVSPGQDIFTGCSPLINGPGDGAFNPSIEANPLGDVVTPTSDGANDYDQATAASGLSSLAWGYSSAAPISVADVTSGTAADVIDTTSTFPATVVVGMTITGTDIPAGDEVKQVNSTTKITMTESASPKITSDETVDFNVPYFTAASNTVDGFFTNASGDGSGGGDSAPVSGVGVTGTGIPNCDTVSSYNSTTGTLTLTSNTTAASGTSQTLSFGASCTKPSQFAPTATTGIPNPFSISQNSVFTGSPGDTNATCPPDPADIDAGLPFCEEYMVNGGEAPTYGVTFIEYSGQSLPNAPTLALSSSNASQGGSVTITDASGACPSSIPEAEFDNTYNCWYGSAETATPVTVTVGGVSSTVTPTNESAGDVSKASYTYPGTTFSEATLSPPQLSASVTVPSNAPLGSDPVQVCESTTPPNGNTWEDGVQFIATKVCASGTLTVTANTTSTGTPTSSSIVLGNSNTDGVTVTGTSAGGSPTGTASFYECGPTITPTACSSKNNQVGSAVNLST